MPRWKVTMLVYDDNLGLSQADDPCSVLRYHAKEGNITIDDFDIEEAQLLRDVGDKTDEKGLSK